MNTHAYANPPAKASTVRPLCVDLDGTLVKSDTLVDSLLLLVRVHPLTALKTPFWLLSGKAAFKERVTSAVSLDIAHLPYNRPLLAYLKEQHVRRGENSTLRRAPMAESLPELPNTLESSRAFSLPMAAPISPGTTS